MSDVQGRQTHATDLATVLRASVVAEALVRKMKSVLLAFVTVALIQRAKSPPTPATEPTAYVLLARNVPERM